MQSTETKGFEEKLDAGNPTVSDSRQLKGGTYYSLEINLCFLIPSCLIFRFPASTGEFRRFAGRTFWAGDFPFAFS